MAHEAEAVMQRCIQQGKFRKDEFFLGGPKKYLYLVRARVELTAEQSVGESMRARASVELEDAEMHSNIFGRDGFPKGPGRIKNTTT